MLYPQGLRARIRISLLTTVIFSLFTTSLLAETKDKTAEDLILEDPVKYYEIFRERLKTFGANAPFPEFKPVVDQLVTHIGSDKFLAEIALHPDLQFELDEVKILLAHVNLTFTFDDEANYPYSLPFASPFPYRPTIDAIEACLRLIDKIDRLKPNSNAVPLYHMDRYAYHRHSLLADTDVIIFPTLRNLTFQDLIRVRAVPIGFVGVIEETMRVDRHYQSPLDFWFHDLNHVRRMVAYIAKLAAKRGYTTDEQKIAFYKEMDDFVEQKIIPNIKALPKGADPEEVALRRVARVIIFEIVHETALAVDRETLFDDLLRDSGPQPFEYMGQGKGTHVGDRSDNVEAIRTATGNLESGSSVVSRDGNAPINIRYFHDRALALLANIYNKLNYGFYDDPEDPNPFVAPTEARKADFLVKAAKYILVTILEAKDIPSDEDLKKLVLSMEGSPEKFAYKRLRDHEGVKQQGQNATDPLSKDEVVQRIKGLNKKVYTLFGYSLLDYQDKRGALSKIRRELEKLDRSEWVINIGATEDGIGAAYQMAKSMGFQTIGLVSTQALTYSGRFSPYVDDIFIVNDRNWGGFIPGTQTLAPATEAYLQVSDVISAHGGGENTAVTITEAKRRGINVRYTPAEMNHDVANKQAAQAARPVPADYKGPAFYAWQRLNTGVNPCGTSNFPDAEN